MPVSDGIRTEVIRIVADVAEVEPQEIAPDATLESLGIDSLGGLRIVAAVEKRWRIVIEEAEIPKIRSMADIYDLMERHGAVG